nr:type II toxin-antitoxin system RelE/ParE family toxin [Fastidiosibacter lacustris]
MIKNFNSKMAEDVFNGVSTRYSRKLPTNLHSLAVRKLDQLNAVTKIEDLNVPPNNKLEKLKGKLSDCWSIRINNQYRIIFKLVKNSAVDVDIVDYH